jgi:hypothetical protein
MESHWSLGSMAQLGRHIYTGLLAMADQKRYSAYDRMMRYNFDM